MSANFDKRNPLQLKIDEDDDEIDPNDQEALLLRQDIEGSRRKSKRNEVKFDYDSDSSDDGKTRRNKINQEQKVKKSTKQDDNDDDDDDMFSDDDAGNNDVQINDSDTERKENKKKAKFLDMSKFEQQEGIIDDISDSNADTSDTNSDSDSDVNESNIDINYFVNPDEPEETTPDSSLKNAKKVEPKLESFHLRTDLEEGNFDQDGNFIRNAMDENAHQDAWLDGVNKHDIKVARKAHLYREKLQSQTESEFVPKCDVIAQLVEHLEIGESPIEALQRLNKSAPKKKKKQPLTENDQTRIKTIESITECCNQLLQSFSMNDIYDISREELLREYQKETGEPYITLKRKRSLSNDDQPPLIEYEFKWEGSDEVHGPYTSEDMAGWVEHNYFDERATARAITNPPSEFVPYDQISF